MSAGWYASNHPYPHKAQSTIENISSAGELLTYPGLAIIVQESCVSSDQYSGNELYIISHSSPPSSSKATKIDAPCVKFLLINIREFVRGRKDV